ncbi:GNAT family N-acetyltransferase [Peribacillus sp. SCS-37]|uniref:GNAT family N-acetyltransferase n=1 Tax=Paraperibacillus esterisolvens TaxID=3115296 RepID=UPI0039069976
MLEKEFSARIETERLVIRPLQVKDYWNWLESFKSRQPSQNRHDPGRLDMSICTQEWFSSLVQKHQELGVQDTAHVFGVFSKEGGGHLGMVDFSTLARGTFQWARIGYTIHNQFWQRGYGSEAVTAAIALAFSELDFHRIEAHINLDNEASIALALSAGMEFECVRKNFIHEHGEWTDHLVYSIIRND